jgi:hypothetical protein
LLHIADHEKVPAVLRYGVENDLLHAAAVLIFVHHDLPEAAGDG